MLYVMVPKIVSLTYESLLRWSHENATYSLYHYIYLGGHVAPSVLSNYKCLTQIPKLDGSLSVRQKEKGGYLKSSLNLIPSSNKDTDTGGNSWLWFRIALWRCLCLSVSCIQILVKTKVFAWSLVMWISSLHASLQGSVVNYFAGGKGIQNSVEMKTREITAFM